jgi:hypothetical protein
LSDERREEELRERDELVENGRGGLFDRIGRISPLPVIPVFMLVPLLLR